MTPRHDPLHLTTAAVTVAVWARLLSDVILSRFAARTPHVTNHTPQCTKLQFYSTTLNCIRPSTLLDSPLKTSAKVPSLCHHFVYVAAFIFDMYSTLLMTSRTSHVTLHSLHLLLNRIAVCKQGSPSPVSFFACPIKGKRLNPTPGLRPLPHSTNMKYRPFYPETIG